MKSRNVPILAVALALNLAGPIIIALIGGLVGNELAPSPAWATLPISLVVVGTAVFIIPASLIMRKIGRKLSFILASLVAGLGALLAAYALIRHDFALFSISSLFMGMNSAFVQQYRFAAAESVEEPFAARAISYVLLGGIFAGFLGPEVAKRTQNLFSDELYVGSFISAAIISAIVIVLLSFMQDIAPPKKQSSLGGRPLKVIARQPIFLLAALSGAAAYGVMTFIMTATPLHMNTTGNFSLANTAWVIQSHIIAMFVPSLFTGRLIERYGVFRVMVTGAMLLLGCTGLAIYSRELIHYWGALVMLGLGWNLMFIGGSVLLTHAHTLEERFKTQAANDFLIFGIRATVSLTAGTVLYFGSWDQLNLIGFSIVLAALVVMLSQRKRLPAQRAEPI